MKRVLSALLILWGATGCTTYKPCTWGGDLTWDKEKVYLGNKMCNQKKGPDKKWVNHGSFIQYDEKGRVIIEGFFDTGKKSGVWKEYDKDGKILKTRYFHKDYELPGLPPRGVTGDQYVEMLEEAKKQTSNPRLNFKKVDDGSTPAVAAPAQLPGGLTSPTMNPAAPPEKRETAPVPPPAPPRKFGPQI